MKITGKRWILPLLIGIGLLMAGCSGSDLSAYVNKETEEPLLSSAEDEDIIREWYQVEDLTGEKAYRTEKGVNFDFTLKKATPENVQTLRNLYMDLILKSGFPIGKLPYQRDNQLQSYMEGNKGLVILRVFEGEKLLHYEQYDLETKAFTLHSKIVKKTD